MIDRVKPALPTWPVAALVALTLAATAHAAFVAALLPDTARIAAIGLDIAALLVALLVLPHNFTIGFLLSLLPFMIAWRVCATFGALPAMAVATVTFLYYVLVFLDAARRDWQAQGGGFAVALPWQMTFLRIYFGFDMVGHLTEKLFAGMHSFRTMSAQFEGFGLPNGAFFVFLSGLCELGITIGIGTGLLARLAGFCAALYYMIANHFGAHFANGFIWSNRPDGGWEFPVLMTVFFLSFTISGAGRFSLDAWLIERDLMPSFLIPLCRPGAAPADRTAPTAAHRLTEEAFG